MKVLYKSGNAKLPGNYRPISILQILYKAFSRIVCERISGELESEQTRDQAGFRKGYSCEDHLLVITLVAEMHLHSGSPLWIAALDFKKAFDSVSHASMWDSMLEHGVHENYVDVMSRLYAQQTAEVQCCQRSKKFAIQRGTKQGDPISPALFNAVLERCLRELVGTWRWQGCVVQLCSENKTSCRTCGLQTTCFSYANPCWKLRTCSRMSRSRSAWLAWSYIWERQKSCPMDLAQTSRRLR